MKRFLLILFLFGLWGYTAPALAKQLPLWEGGIGGTALLMPDYRGSEESRWYFFPFPYVVYRGDILKIDKEKISGVIFKTKRLQLDLSFHGSQPVDSSKNKARQGMPDLDPNIEVGPCLQVLLAEDKTAEYKVTLTFPVRAVLASDFSRIYYAGYNFTPRLNIDQFNIGKKGWDFGLSIGPIFGDKVYHDYYYKVDPAYAAPGRPAYSSKAGYGGLQCTLYLGQQFKKLVWGMFVRGEDLRGTAFSESPLLKNSFSFMGGVYFSWIFMESKTMVEADK
jgi:outer membrane scaffolding protein for murein synthesis (MipA/OmpV family)